MMSFLSEMLPVWSQAAAEGGEEQSREHKTWTEVKLPSIPIELSKSIEDMSLKRPQSRALVELTARRPQSRALPCVKTATERDADSCLFCGNQTCRANQTEHTRSKSTGVVQEKRSPRPKRQRSSRVYVHTPNTVFGNTASQLQPESSPRSLVKRTVSLKTNSPNVHVPTDVSNIGATASSAETSPEGKSGWEPFSCTCQYCGEKFGKHSVSIHEKHCQKHHNSHSSKAIHRRIMIKPQNPRNESESGFDNFEMQKVATIVTVGLESGIEKSTIYAKMPPRPETRTLQNSMLRSNGYGVPLASLEPGKFQETTSSVQCKQCQQIVAIDRLSIHRRVCKPSGFTVSPCDVIFPSMCDLLRPNDDSVTAEQPLSVQKRSKPPTKICYICGREFGSLSIAIHEPQCLKKLQAENKKLPISERKPIPKKRESKPTIARGLSRDATASGIIKSLPDNVYKDEGLTEKLVQRYFENCYSEFKRDLIPCKKCGRTFTSDRHTVHEPKCNAKPLSRNASAKK